jgi:hypothetical protein
VLKEPGVCDITTWSDMRAGIEDDDGRIYKHEWMRWRTFNRLMDSADAAGNVVDDAFVLRALKILGMQ